MRFISKKENCSRCGKKKTGSYLKESWCRDCTGEARRERNRKRRAEKGLRPIGSGRDPNCKICREPKEERYFDGSYCAKCKLERLKIAYDKKKEKEGSEPRRVGRNPICKCGKAKEKIKEALCNACDAAKRRAYHEKNKDCPIYKLKIAARQTVKRYLKLGRISKEPCIKCGEEKVDAHHEDYMKPLEVIWLCRKHHAEHHKNLNKDD